MQCIIFLALLVEKQTLGKKKKKENRIASPRTQRTGLTVLLEVVFSAVLIVLPSREHPVTECSLKYLSALVSEAVFF